MQENAEASALEETKSDLRLVLDEAMSKLDSVERNAVLLRFFQGKDLKEVGAALGVSEDAARMRVNRSLGKLHALLTKRGVTVSAAALGVALTSETISAVPAGMVVTIAEGALASTAMGTVTTVTIAKILTMTKLKIGIAGAIVVAGVATPLALQHNSQAKLRVEIALAHMDPRIGHDLERLPERLSGDVDLDGITPRRHPHAGEAVLVDEAGGPRVMQITAESPNWRASRRKSNAVQICRRNAAKRNRSWMIN